MSNLKIVNTSGIRCAGFTINDCVEISEPTAKRFGAIGTIQSMNIYDTSVSLNIFFETDGVTGIYDSGQVDKARNSLIKKINKQKRKSKHS